MLLRLSLVHQNPPVLPVRRGENMKRALVLLLVHAAAGCLLSIDGGDDDGGDAESSTSSSSDSGTSFGSASESSIGQESSTGPETGTTSEGSSSGPASESGPTCVYTAGPYEPCSDECPDCSDGACTYPAAGVGLAHCSYDCGTASDCPESQSANPVLCHDGMCWIGCVDGECPDGQECFDLMIEGVPPRCLPPELQPA